MPYFLDGNCVKKGTKEDPGETVKCHEDHAAALAHLKTLYANVEDADEKRVEDADEKRVEDADKGGPGSGWHNPPKGTHDAEHAPNFAGGPGADRKYGTESDEPPEGAKRCKCTKCGAVVVLPKGKQCEDIKCPACEGGMSQEKPREDKPAEGEGGRNPKAGREKAAQETHACTCPECDKTVHVPMGQKCSEVKCPGCKTEMGDDEEDEDKAVHGEGSMIGETSAVMDDGGSGCKCPHCGESLPCTAKACPHCKKSLDKVDRKEDTPSEAKSDEGERPGWTIYKAADGTWRWLTLSNWAVVDKESEVVSEQAYRDAIAHAQKTNDWGQLDLVHVSGTDVGDCDMLFIVKGDEPAKFGAGGTWYDTPKATKAREAVQAEPDYWGVSIKFRFNPQKRVKGIYTGDIEVLKHSILPQAMAASYGTAIAVQGGERMSKALDEKAAEALAKLGHSEDEIAELAEKQKALPPEENVMEKEAEAPVTKTTLLTWLKELFTEKAVEAKDEEEAPVASMPEEAGKADEVNDPANAAEPAEEEKAGGDPVEAEAVGADIGALLGPLGETIAKSVGEMVRDEMAKRDDRIAELEEAIKLMAVSVEEKVAARLRDLPPVVKVSASEMAASVVPDGKPQGLTFGQQKDATDQYAQKLLGDISRVIKQEMQGAQYKV